jgi:hypothetical protein
MRESTIENAVIEHGEATGWFTRKITYAGRHGCRDRDFYGFGQIVMIEFKRPGSVPRPHQERERKRMAQAGLKVHVIDDIERGKALLDSMRTQ